MATRTGNTTRSSTSRRSQGSMRETYRDDMDGGSQQESYTGRQHGLRREVADGIRVSAEMPSSKVARITIDIDWQHLVSRVARTVGRKIKSRRGSRSAAQPRRRSTAPARRSSRA